LGSFLDDGLWWSEADVAGGAVPLALAINARPCFAPALGGLMRLTLRLETADPHLDDEPGYEPKPDDIFIMGAALELTRKGRRTRLFSRCMESREVPLDPADIAAFLKGAAAALRHMRWLAVCDLLGYSPARILADAAAAA